MDSFATLFSGGGESMNDFEIGLCLMTLNQMAARTGTAILVTHHLKKGASRDNRGNLRPITALICLARLTSLTVPVTFGRSGALMTMGSTSSFGI